MSDVPLHCSFCGKSRHDVSKLIAGPAVFICDECTVACGEIIADQGGKDLLMAAIPAARILREFWGANKLSDHGRAVCMRLERVLEKYTIAGVSEPELLIEKVST